MTFETHQIRPDQPEKEINPRPTSIKNLIKKHFLIFFLVLIVGYGVGVAVFKVITLAQNFSFREIVLSIFSQPLKTDQYNHTNILFLGVGGAKHEGPDLTDSIMVVSLDHKNHLIPILSLPRDLYVNGGEIGENRINRIYELGKLYYESSEEGLKLAQQVVAETLNIPIHYYAKIDFEGFVEIVDALGGINIDLEEDFFDPYYPKENGLESLPTGQAGLPAGQTGYEPFYLEAGNQHLDGETALKYARSRKTTSDFDRAKRQQEILNAVKEKALSLGILTSPSKLKKLYEAFSSNFESDLTLSEIIYLGKISRNFEKEDILTQVLNDDPLTAGGLLYTPEREYFGGAFVLVPQNNTFEEIRLFTQLFLYQPLIFKENIPLQVLNGTKQNLLATEVKSYLERYGLKIVRFGNGPEIGIPETKIYSMTGEYTETLKNLTSLIPGEVETELPEKYWPQNWETEAEIIIDLGEDFKDFYQAKRERFY